MKDFSSVVNETIFALNLEINFLHVCSWSRKHLKWISGEIKAIKMSLLMTFNSIPGFDICACAKMIFNEIFSYMDNTVWKRQMS